MSISYYSPNKQKENDANFLSACASFQAGNYLEAAKSFKIAYERNRSKKWFLMNYATSIRNAGHIDFSMRIYDWLQDKYPRYKLLDDIFKKTIKISKLVSQNQNPCQLLHVPFFKSIPGYPQKEYLIDEDFHNISISLCMIVKNEAINLKKAIESVNLIVDEKIIVDTGSNDGTPEIAKSLDADVFHFKWNDNFSEARNFSIKQATKEWILVLDGDESISYYDLFYIKENIKENKEYWGFALIQRDYFNEMILGGIRCENDFYEEGKTFACYKTQEICRIIKNSQNVYFSFPVYELAEESIKLNGGEFAYTDIVIHHYGRLMDRNKSIAKRKYYINILKKYLGPNEPDRRRAVYCSNIARAYSFIGEHKKGLKYLKKAIEFNPKLSVIYFDLGNNAIFRKAYFEATEWLEKAISLDNKRPEYYISAAQAYTFLGNLIKAFEMMQRCLAVDPQNPIALNFISEISAKGIL
jgi:glycosyltransferase involved in cell wall biosynthesis